MVGLVARRGPAVVAFVASIGLIAAHVGLRSRWWRYEWGWAWYQFHFATIILAPVTAGIACAWGARWGKYRTSLGTAPRAVPALVGLALVPWGAVVAAYAVGLVAVSLTVASSSRTGVELRVLLTLAPPMALLFACCALGLAVGVRGANRVLAPLVAVATFVVLLVGYTAGPARFVKVGGATATLVGLAPRPVVQIGQVLLYLGVGVAALVAVAALGPRVGTRLVRTGVILLVMVGSGSGLLIAAGDREFDHHRVELVCEGQEPRICVAPGYRVLAGELRSALAPHYRALEAASLPAPRNLVQLPVASLPDGVLIDPVSVLRSPEFSDGYLLSGFIPEGCRRIDSAHRAGQGFAALADFLQRAYPQPEVVVTDGERVALRAAYDDLVGCRA
jgi:hypothetical protein